MQRHLAGTALDCALCSELKVGGKPKTRFHCTSEQKEACSRERSYMITRWLQYSCTVRLQLRFKSKLGLESSIWSLNPLHLQ